MKRHHQKIVLADILSFRGSVRIPVSGSIPLADEVRMIIDTPEFQRLRGVRQLGPTHFVYPGAVHTRFEHSLGTYALSLRYVEALLARDEFYQLGENPIKMARLLIAGALLHDVGHYPFSHLIEEIGELPRLRLKKHEARAEHFIKTSQIGVILQKFWGLNPELVCKIIKGQKLYGAFAVVGTTLSGVLDLDKLDYLVRDSIHCGVNFGLALDANRFLSGLRIDRDNMRICISAKTESYIPTLITVRNLMYNEVYWHKTVRASVAMMKMLVSTLCKDESFSQAALDAMLLSKDDRMADQIYTYAECAKNDQAMQFAKPFVFGGRGLYKCVYALSSSDAHGRPAGHTFLGSMLESTLHATCVAKASSLEKALQPLVPSVIAGDIIIEATPVKRGHEKFDLHTTRFLDDMSSKMVNPTYDIEAADSLLDHSRKVFVFCHPDRASRLRTLTNQEWENVFRVADK